MTYLLIAAIVYVWTAGIAINAEAPANLREVIAIAFLCVILAVLWPAVLLWRSLLELNGASPGPTSSRSGTLPEVIRRESYPIV